MNHDIFASFLHWLGVVADGAEPSLQSENGVSDLNSRALQHMTLVERRSLVAFIDKKLSAASDPTELGALFNDGHVYVKWSSEDGPRKELEAIRDAASASP